MYALKFVAALSRYCANGAIETDNSAPAERALCGIAIGFRNYLFAGADSGAVRMRQQRRTRLDAEAGQLVGRHHRDLGQQRPLRDMRAVAQSASFELDGLATTEHLRSPPHRGRLVGKAAGEHLRCAELICYPPKFPPGFRRPPRTLPLQFARRKVPIPRQTAALHSRERRLNN
jgi:hypothetical protein